MFDYRRRRSNGRVWLRRNVWLVAVSALLLIYCVFVMYTTMWTQSSSAHKKLTQDMEETMSVPKGTSVRRDDTTQRVTSELAQEAGKDRREGLHPDTSQIVRIVVTTRPTFHRDKEDTAAYNDKVPLEDDGVVPMVGVTVDGEHEVSSGEAAHQTIDQQMTDQSTTASEDLPRAKTDSVTATPDKRNATESKDLALPTVLITELVKDNNRSWTNADELPMADGEVVEHRAAGSTSPAVSTALQISAPFRPSESRKRFDKSRLVLQTPEQLNASVPFETRHHTIIGYNATLAYLQSYTKPANSDEELFLFFTCSTSEGNRDDWNPNCAIAREKVYAIFAKSPSTNRLVTIYAGPHDAWIDNNDFTDDDDLRLKAVPTLMRWDGGAPGARRSTWGVLVDMSILYDPLVHYLFRTADEQDKLLVNPEVATKEIVTLRGYAPYRAFVETYAATNASYPLFILLLSGRWEHNNRLWCPWCRQSELPVEYAFYAYAPAHATLVLVETYDNRSEWRSPNNEFKLDAQLNLKGVPWFLRVYPGPPGEPLVYERVKKKFYILEALQQVFTMK